MLTKLAAIPDVDEFGFTRVIPFGPRGQGLEKYAGLPDGVQKYVDHHHVKVSDGKVGVLLVAMGATEYWGSNSNGDIWYEPCLLHVPPNWADDPDTDQALAKGWGWGYPTFYNAKSFAHHCFPAGTQITMSDRSRLAVEFVQEGDSVATGDGNGDVTRVMQRRYTGPGVHLRLRGDFRPLVSTADHPVLVYRRDQIHCPHKYNRLNEHFGCKYPGCKASEVGPSEWAPASSILPGDYLVMPVPKHGTASVESWFSRMVGWVASEGYLHKSGCIQFTFGHDSQADISDVISCFKEAGVEVQKYPRPQYGDTVMLNFYDPALSARLGRYITGVLSNKTLTAEVLTWDELSLRSMLGPYVNGDGHVAGNGQNKGQLRIRSSSEGMLRILADIIRSLGVPATIQWDIPAGNEIVSPTNGKIYVDNGSGVVTVSASWAKDIVNVSRKYIDFNPAHNYRTKQAPEGFLVQVTEREDVDLDEDVYNLEVKDQHTYLAGEVLVHNCNKSPEKSIGDISYATWDPFMHWVLLVVSLDVQRCHKFGGDWMLERVAAKRSVPWSMGSRVPFDLSSTSPDEERYLQVWNSFDPSKYKTPAEAILAEHGRKPIYGLSRTRRDYPQELLYNMGTILSDGRKIGAINDFPNFFDISGVGVPADPTAWSIMKLGSTRCELSGTKCSGSCKHGACRKYTTPGVVLWDQMEEQMSKAASVHEASLGKGGAVRKSADIDKDTPPQVQSSAAVDPEDPDLPKDLLNRMGQDLPLDQSLSTPSLMGMVLKPREFRRIVMVHMGKRDLADKLDDSKTDMPRVLDSESPCSMDSESFNDILGPILSSFLDHRSCLGPVLGRVKITIIKAEPKGSSEPKDEPELERKVAALYNGYRKIVLEKIGNVKQVVATRPWLHNAIFGVDFLNKTGSLSGTLVPLVTPQTLRYLRG